MPGPKKIRSLSQGGLERFHRATNAGNFKRRRRSTFGRLRDLDSADKPPPAHRDPTMVTEGEEILRARRAVAAASTLIFQPNQGRR